MARKLRIECAGAVYHVVSRGDRRESIFKDDRDGEAFVGVFGQCCNRTGCLVHALRLMRSMNLGATPKGTGSRCDWSCGCGRRRP